MSTISKATWATTWANRAKGLAKGSLILATLITSLSIASAHDGHQRPVCPPYHSEYWGHFPTCWRPWPAGWHEQCCRVAHVEADPTPLIVRPAPVPMPEKQPEKAPMPKPMPDMTRKAAPAPAQNWTSATVIMDPPAIIKTSAKTGK